MRRPKLRSGAELARQIKGYDRPVLQGKGDMAAGPLMCGGKSILCKQYLRELEHPSAKKCGCSLANGCARDAAFVSVLNEYYTEDEELLEVSSFGTRSSQKHGLFHDLCNITKHIRCGPHYGANLSSNISAGSYFPDFKHMITGDCNCTNGYSTKLYNKSFNPPDKLALTGRAGGQKNNGQVCKRGES